MKFRLVFFLLLFFSSKITLSQNIINSQAYTFDSPGLDGWTSENLLSTNEGFWVWKENGKADAGDFWDNRDSICSASLGGAAIYDSDGNFANGIGNPNLPVEVALNSPVLNFQGAANVYLKFNQYFRNYQTDTRVEVSIDNGMSWTTFNLNDNVNLNVETSAADVQIVDISMPAAGVGEVLVRFVFSGDYYFWILDDIEFWDDFPYPQTFPEYVGDSLVAFNIPYEVDKSNWAYTPDELVVQFSEDATEIEKENIRDTMGAILIDSCVCNRLELWRLGDDVFAGGDTLSNFGGSIGILERAKGTKSKSKVDGADLNRLNYNELQNNIDIPNPPLLNIPNNIPTSTGDPILIAILDTGIDYNHDSLASFIYLNDDGLGNSTDDDSNCNIDDPIGWNFVDDNNNPADDHGHGTHVAGIIRNNLANQDLADCEYKMIAYKTHNAYGVSDLFDVTCATYQAIEDSVSVVNDSWGFYGDTSIILNNAIDTAKTHDILIIAASGNDTIDLADAQQYPACNPQDNVIAVGSIDTLLNDNGVVFSATSSEFSNYNSTWVDILAEGKNIYSTLPVNTFGFKSGTSMSTPKVAAAAAIAYCSGFSDYGDVKNSILDCAYKFPTELGLEVLDGNVLNTNICITPIENILETEVLDFVVYPNPTTQHVMINTSKKLENSIVQIYNLTGQLVLEKHINEWNAYQPQELDLNNFPAGSYFLKIKNRHYIWSHKLLKI